ncbi:MAG: HAD-IIB family hydrolase [Betaproteobacteria bacterium]|nr:HAD-IIB family hydrolase [Betaproteobacteria bacterium]
MLPLRELPAGTLANIRGVFFDIDDTLTTDGCLTAAAYGALELLKAHGLLAVPVTGRPAGWCDHIARMWPVDGVVGENGAFWFAHDHAAKKMTQRFIADAATRAERRERMREIGERILSAVPGTAWASDQHYREADIAIDFCEDVPALPRAEVERIAALMREAGLTAKISSIHVNGWFGEYDKLSTTRLFMRERFGIELDSAKERYLFIGDSPNDAPMFAWFPNAIGVANIRELAGLVPHWPAYVTEGRSGAGFEEVVNALIGARSR